MSSTITEKTRLPISLVILIVVASASGVGLFAAIKADVSDLRRISTQSLTREEFKDWRYQLERRNNYLDVPDLEARDPRRAVGGSSSKPNPPVAGLPRP